MVSKGYFVITDISGYTSFLTDHELDHAQHIIEALFKSQLDRIGPPLNISNFQGDAILCYAPEDSVQEADKLLDQITAIYKAFSEKTAEMQIDPPCSCNACAEIGTLDLKVFVHYGDYLVKSLGDRDELMGSDVILAHRMMKNSVKEKTGIQSYLLMTDAALARLKDAGDRFPFVAHSESYEHIGDVGMQVASLR
jgi:Protein of unknown function (DUF2652)